MVHSPVACVMFHSQVSVHMYQVTGVVLQRLQHAPDPLQHYVHVCIHSIFHAWVLACNITAYVTCRLE